MKKVCNLLILGIVLMLIATGCKGNEDVEIVEPHNIYGYWKKTTGNEYLRFMTEQEDMRDGDYLFGYEWNEDDEVYESDVLNQPHGNGWFKYKITTDTVGRKTTTTLFEIMKMDYGWADIPKQYKVSVLSSSKMVYEDDYSKTFQFSKVTR